MKPTATKSDVNIHLHRGGIGLLLWGVLSGSSADWRPCFALWCHLGGGGREEDVGDVNERHPPSTGCFDNPGVTTASAKVCERGPSFTVSAALGGQQAHNMHNLWQTALAPMFVKASPHCAVLQETQGSTNTLIFIFYHSTSSVTAGVIYCPII